MYGNSSGSGSRKRTVDGLLRDCSQLVSVSFNELVPSGESSFTISLPRSHGSVQVPGGEPLRRHFYFAELKIVPGFYSQRALQLGVDGDEGRDEKQNTFALSVGYSALPNLYFRDDGDGNYSENRYSQNRQTPDVGTMLKRINSHFETLKPEGFKSSPFFFDWISLAWNPDYEAEGENETVVDTSAIFYDAGEEEEYREPEAQEEGEEVSAAAAEGGAAGGEEGARDYLDADRYVPAVGHTYYQSDYDRAVHYNALEPSVRRLPGVNNFAFPYLETEQDDFNAVRVRMHIAPNTKMSFSSNKLLESLGFTVSTFKERAESRKFSIENKTSKGYMVLTAESPPPERRVAASTSRISIAPSLPNFAFDAEEVKLTNDEIRDNALVFAKVEAAFKTASSKANIDLKLTFSQAENKFSIDFPPNPRLTVFLDCDRRLSERLGYGPNHITQNLLPAAVRDRHSNVEAGQLSRALAFDAGMAIITFDSLGAIDMHGVDDYQMATLFPTTAGDLSMTNRMTAVHWPFAADSLQEPRSIFLPSVGAGQHMVNLKFNVRVMTNNSKSVPFKWPIHFYARGILEGRL